LQPELFIDLDRRHVRASLEAALRSAIQTGRFRPDARMPSSRALAGDLGVARNTVVEIYGQLVAEGWLIATAGSGTVVGHRTEPRRAAVADAPSRVSVSSAGTYDLSGGTPDPTGFPRAAWLAAARRALREAPADAFGYQGSRGRPELRAALAEYLARVRDVYVQADQIIICLGAMHGLRLIGKALRGLGHTTWATESYGWAWHRRAASGLGFTLRVVPVDDEGAQVEQFGNAGSMLLSPAHQFPLGVALSPKRRVEAVNWAKTTNSILIEDDYDGEFRHDRRPVGALQSLAPEQVIYVGTASKSLSPALRLGWMVVPPHLVRPILAAKTVSDGHNSTIDQLTLAEFIRSGNYDRHVRRSKLLYRRRRDLLVATTQQFETIRIKGIAAGMHALLELPPTLEEAAVVEHARGQGLRLDGLSAFAAQPLAQQRGPALVIGYGAAEEGTFPEALKRLSQTLDHFKV